MSTEERIAQLEEQIHELHDQQADLRKQLAKAQLDQWQGRIEDLEVQMHLGAMEASDKANARLSKLATDGRMPGSSSRKASRRRPAWRTRCAPGWRRPSTICARRSLSLRTS
jgi:TolA-binding protein